MTAAPATTPPTEPQPLRRDLSEHHATELTVVPRTGVTLHAFEALGARGESHDAAVFLSPAQIVEHIGDMTQALHALQPVQISQQGIHSVEGRAAAELLRRSFVALQELEKVSTQEVETLYREVVGHVRSVKAHTLLVMP